MRKGILIGIAVLACAGLVAATASAARTASSVTIKNTARGTYEGKVKSSKGKCRRGRTIDVWHDVNNDGVLEDPPDFQIGTARTDSNGDWKLENEEQPPSSTPYLVAVLHSKKGCKGDRTSARAGSF